MGDFYIPKFRNVKVRLEGEAVQLVENGTLLLELPWEAARKLAKAIRAQSARAEQNNKIDRVIADQALMIRKGFPIAIDPRPEVFKEAGKEAAWNSEFRRASPGSIPTGVKFGYPTLRGKPPKARIGVQGIPSAEKFGRIG
jgi:hypothetical protein